MIDKELEKIVREEKGKNSRNDFIRNLLKEYLQVYVLYFIYTSPEYNKNMIFTGGTCLRHFFGLDRLSEDLDFGSFKKINNEKLQKNLEAFFGKRYQYKKLTTSLRQNGRQLLLKFPVLRNLGLAAQNTSDLLHVKIDLADNPPQQGKIETTSLSKYGFNFVAKHYDLPTLMAGKIHAILTRRRLIDFFDLLWFIKNSVNPNLKRLSYILKRKVTLQEIEGELDKKIKKLVRSFRGDFEADLIPLLKNSGGIKNYAANYLNEYLRFKHLSFTS